jgi:hypothetical protein
MEFTTQGKKFVLRGAMAPKLQLVNNKSFTQIVQQGAELCFMSIEDHTPIFYMPSCQAIQATSAPVTIPAPICHVIEQFEDIFQVPSQLPPSRPGFDHKIPLKEGAEAFNLRPYRYSIVQKNIIDQLVQDMMDQGIIQHSNSPFASPTVLVRKKDGSWRLCVDFRRLNSHTIKDRFPIPLIEDLLDELGGSSIFSK